MSDPSIFINESHRILKKKGRIILISRTQFWHFLEKIRDKLRIGAKDHLLLRLQLYYPYELERLLSDVGFKDIETECFCVMPIKGFNFLDKTPLRRFGHIALSTGVKK